MFNRPDETYTLNSSVIDAILKDESSPHYNIFNRHLPMTSSYLPIRMCQFRIIIPRSWSEPP